MPGEQLAEPNPLETELLGERNLQAWHTYLTTSSDGKPSGHLDVPASRYGRTGADCAWTAIAVEYIVFIHGDGDTGEQEESMDYMMGLAVNNHDSVAELLNEYWLSVPEAIRERIGDR